MPKTDLESHINSLGHQVIEEKGWRTFRDFKVDVSKKHLTMGAYITLAERRISILVPEFFNEILDLMVHQEKLSGTRNNLVDALVYTAIVHEHGHHQHCPKHREGIKRIMAGSFDALKGMEHKKERIESLCFYIHNLFSDTILDTINAHTDPKKEKYRLGRDLIHLVAAHSQSVMARRLGQKKSRPDKAMALFYNSCHLLQERNLEIGDRMQKYLPKFFIGYPRYTRKIIDIFTGDKALSDYVIKRELNEEMTCYLVDRLQDTSLWNRMSYDYTNIIYPFIKKEEEYMNNSFTRGEGNSSGNSSGDKDCNSEDDENKSCQSGSNGTGDEDENNKGKAPKDLQDFLDGLFEEDAERDGSASSFVPNLALLDKLYKERAGKLALAAEEEVNQNLTYSVGSEPMPLSEFKIEDVDWASTRIHEKNDGTVDIELYRKNNPLNVSIETEENPWGIPDLSFIFDSSLSMLFKPFEGDGRGEYHLAALTFYSILRNLEEEGIAPLLNYNVINFSKETKASGWQSYADIVQVKKALFDYQGNMTMLNPKKLAELREKRLDNFLSFMLSDGGFNTQKNEDKVVEEIEKMQATGGIGFYYFNIGPSGSFAKTLRQKGIPVQNIDSVEDFMGTTIRFTRGLYGELKK